MAIELTGSAKRVITDYDAWKKYSASYRRRWLMYWKQWNNKRVKIQYKPDIANSIDPMAHQMVESRVDNIYGSRPKWTFIPTMPEQDNDTKILTGMADYSWDKANMDYEIIGTGREIEITGNTGIFTGWADGQMTMIHIPIADCIFRAADNNPFSLSGVGYRRLAMLEDLKKEQEFDPSAGDKDEDGNPKGAWVPKYQNLDKVRKYSSDDQQFDKALKEQIWAGSTLPDDQKDGQVEVIRMLYLDKIVEIANRGGDPIYEKDNMFRADARQVDVQLHNDDAEPMFDENSLPAWAQGMAPEELAANKSRLAAELQPAPTKITIPAIEPFLPFAMGRGFVDPAILLAKGTMETISELVEDLQDEINIKKDNLIYRQQHNSLVDRNQAELIPKLAQARAGAFIEADGIAEGKIPVHALEKPELSSDSDVEIARIKQSIRDTARVAEMVQGVDGIQNKTATEVNAQVAGASSGFVTQNKNLESGLYKMLGEQFWKMVQIFVTREQLVRVVGKEGIEFKKFDPNKYFGVYDCKVQLESTAKAQAQAQAETLIKGVEMILNNPLLASTVNPMDISKLVLQKVSGMDDDELKLIMNAGEGATQGGLPTGDVADGTSAPVPGAPLAPGAPPAPVPPSATAVAGPDGQVHESADLVKLFVATSNRPGVQDQILQAMGFDPGETPPIDVQQTAQDMAHKDANLAMQVDKHTKEMAQPAPVAQ